MPGESPEDLARHRDAFFDALADDFNTPRALAAAHAWVNEANRRTASATRTCARCSACSASRTCSTPRPARRRSSSQLAEDRDAGPRSGRLRRGRPPARRAARRGLGGPRRARRAATARRGAVIVYGRNPVREALRGRAAGEAASGRPRTPRASRGSRRRAVQPGDAATRSPSAAARTPTRACAPRSRPTPTPTPPTLLAATGPVPRRARRGHRPAEPRRGLPDRRGRGGHRRRASPSGARPR